MWNPGVTGPVGGSGLYAQNGGLPNSVSTASAADVAAVRQQVDEWLRAAPGSKAQTASSLIDRLKVIRERTGDGTFKNNLNKLIQTLGHYVEAKAAVGQPMQQQFPDAGDSSLPNTRRSLRYTQSANIAGLRNQQRVNNQTPNHSRESYDYYTSKSHPGRKPSTGSGPGNIWSGFSQGKDGNCITVAAIKAAMMRFGQKPTDIFNQVKLTGDGYDVVMRDGFRLHLSRSELATAAQRSDFKGTDSAMLADACFLYAASAKRAQWENNDGYASRSFDAALYSINDGDSDRRDGLRRLGLSAHIRVTDVRTLGRGQLGVVTHGVPINGLMTGHSMAVINGQEEKWGAQGGHPPTHIYANALALV